MHTLVLAATSITDTPIWSVVDTVAKALGVIFVLFGIINTVRQLAAGKTAGAVKGAAITIIAAAFLFNISLIEDILRALQGVVDLVVKSFESLTGTGGGTGGGGTGGGGTGGGTGPAGPAGP